MFKANPLESIKQTLCDAFFSNDLTDERTFTLYIPPFGKENIQDKAKPFDVLGYIQAFVEDPQKKSLLVLGDSGMGKTLLSQYVAQQIWKNAFSLKAEVIPIYISLPAMANRQGELKERLLETHLEENRGLKKENILYLKTQKILLLIILDGVDEIRLSGNISIQNQWEQWNLKVLYTCRLEALTTYQNYQQYFYSNTDNPPATFSEVRLCPFNNQQIEQYIRKQLEILSAEDREDLDGKDAKWLSAEPYLAAIHTWPGLRELVEIPFILSMLLKVLPKIEKQPEEHITRAELYREFTQKWFERQAIRLQRQKQFPLLKGKLSSYLLHYAKNLALDRLVEGELDTMIDSQKTVASYLLVPKDPELLESFRLDQGVLEENIEAIRSGCLLKTQGKDFKFLHKSILEYLAAEELLQGALGLVQVKTCGVLIANKKAGYAFQEQLLVDEPEIIARLAESAQKNDAFKEALWQLIKLSKEDSYYTIAAANAITVWNKAGFRLFNRDLKNARLAGADLRHAVLVGSQLDGADLQNVRLSEANLNLASLRGANLTGIQLEQKPMLTVKRGFDHFAFEPEGSFSKNRVAVSNIYDDSSYLSSCPADSYYVSIYQVETGDLLARLENWSFWRTGLDPVGVYDVIWQPQGKQLAVSSSDRCIRIWDMQHYQCSLTLKIGESYSSNLFDMTKQYKIAKGGMSYHPSGEQLISLIRYPGCHWWAIWFWNTANGKKEKILEKQDLYSTPPLWGLCCFYSPNEKQLVIGFGEDILFLNAKSGEKEKVLKGDGRCICYSPDGNQLASAGRDIILWDVNGNKQKVLQWYKGGYKGVTSLAYRPDGKQLASASDDMTIALWDVVDGTKQRELQSSCPVYSLSYYLHGQLLASTGKEGIHFWQMLGGDERIKGLVPLAKRLSYRPDGLQFASVQIEYPNFVVHVWNAGTGKLERMLRGENRGPYIDFRYSPDGQQLALYSGDKIVVWEITSGKQQCVLYFYNKDAPFMDTFAIFCLCYRSDGLQLAAGGEGSIYLCDPLRGNGQIITLSLKGREDRLARDRIILSLTYHPTNGRQLASVDEDCYICLWDTVTGKLEKEWKCASKFRFLSYRPDGQQLASIGNDEICLWNLENYPCLQLLKQPGVTCSSYGWDGQYLASLDSNNHIYLWDTSNGNRLAIFNLQDLMNFSALSLQFTPHRTLLVGFANSVSVELEWKAEANQFRIKHISNKIFTKLSCFATQLDNSFGLSEANFKVLEQHGAKGLPGKDKYWSRGSMNTLFQAAKPLKQSVQNIVGNHVFLDDKFGAVSLVRSRDGNHAFFLIEVATTRGIKIHFADLTTPDGLLLQSMSHAKASIRMEPWHDDPKYTKLKEKVKDEFIYRTFQVPLDKLNQFYGSIEQDKHKDIYYSMSGGLGLFSIAGRTYQNCLTWCVEKLKEINITLPKKWLPSPKLYLPAIEIEEAPKSSVRLYES
jgi:WD40 repeat protein